MLLLTLLLLQPSQPVTVCDVMPRLTDYDRKLVELSGIVHSDYHVFQLVGEGCKQHFVTSGYRWPPVLMLALTGGYLGHRMAGQSIDFGFVSNKESLQLLQKAKERVKRDIRRRRIRAVVEGMILTGGPTYHVDNVPAPTSVDGFGHGGQAPAVLVIKTIKRVEVIDSNGKVIQ